MFLLGAARPADAAVIANWDKDSRSWNNNHMSRIKAAMQAAGHRVEADGAITPSVLKISTIYVMGEPTANPTPTELGLLREFVTGGGMLILFGDTGIDLPTYNGLLAGIGSSITFTTTTISTTSALPDGQFTNGPNRIVGNTLSVSSGNGTAGGTQVDNNFVRFEHLGAGYVVVFGDRLDHNEIMSDTNAALLLNIVGAAAGPVVPVPVLDAQALAALVLLLTGAGLAAIRRRKTVRAVTHRS